MASTSPSATSSPILNPNPTQKDNLTITLTLTLPLCLMPTLLTDCNKMFLCGDSAQTIAKAYPSALHARLLTLALTLTATKGVGFRFSDLKAIFHHQVIGRGHVKPSAIG